MPAVEITIHDLEPFADIDIQKASAMIDDAMARAAIVAPCITSETFEFAAAAKAIIRGAILRWNDSGTGAYQQESAGPFMVSMDTRTTRKGMFLPSEVDELKALCSAGGEGKAFSIGTAPFISSHSPYCSLMFGAVYCSCGADLTLDEPLWEVP